MPLISSQSTLRDVVAAGGYDVVVTADDWIAKELTLIARKPAHELPPRSNTNAVANVAAVQDRVEWVVMLGQQIRALAAKNALGLFGTSIAATWLQEELQGKRLFLLMKTRAGLDKYSWDARFCVPAKFLPGGRS